MALPDNSQPAASDRNFLLLTAVVTDELQQLELPGSSTSFFFSLSLLWSGMLHDLRNDNMAAALRSVDKAKRDPTPQVQKMAAILMEKRKPSF